MNAPTTLAVSRLTGRPVRHGSAVALPAGGLKAAALEQQANVPAALAQIIRPTAAYRWILPQLAAITPTYIEGVLRGAFTGSHLSAWELFDLMEDTWPRLSKNLNELKRAVQALEWKLEPWADEDEPPSDSALEKMQLVSNAIWRMRPDPAADENAFHQTIYDLLDAWGKGLTVLEILWEVRQAGQLGDITAPRATTWVQPVNYGWSNQGRLGLNPNALNPERGTRNSERGRLYLTPVLPQYSEELVEFPPDKFLIAIAKAKSGHALCGALLRPLAWWWCAANFSADWLMNFAQVFGLPFRWANFADGAPQATIDKICTMLENMGSAGWAAFPEGTTLELKEASKGGEQSPQADLIDRADKNCDLLLLGQTLTSDSGGMGAGGGSLALGKVHAGVKDENVRAAANFAVAIINQQLIPAIIRQNYENEDECPEFCAEKEVDEVEAQAKLKLITDSYGVAVRAGLVTPNRADEEHFRRLADLPAITPEVDKAWKANPTREPITIQDESGNAQFPGQRRQTGPASGAAAEAKQAPRISPSASDLNRFFRAQAEDFAPLRDRLARIKEIKDPMILRARLASLLEELPSLAQDINADPKSAQVLEDTMSAVLQQALRRQ